MRSQSLGRMLSFVQLTVVGGVFVLAPLVLLSIVIGHAVQIAYAMVLPIVKWMPVTSASRVSLALVVGCVAVVLACFLAGLLAGAPRSRNGSSARWNKSSCPSFPATA